MTITELNIHWIRHGYSCANIHKWIHATIHDPVLTYDGLECSLKSAKKVPNISYDFIFCSALKRAMETALAMFPKDKIKKTKIKKILSVPFIGEKGFGFDNTKSNIEHLKLYFSKFSKLLDLTLHKKMKKEMNIVDMDGFFNFLNTYLEKFNLNGTVNIAIVTHSHFMKANNISEGKTKPNNNSIFEVNYQVGEDNEKKAYSHPFKRIKLTKIYNGCIFKKDPYIKKLTCTKKKTTCKKTPIESGKHYVRCSYTKKYTPLKKLKTNKNKNKNKNK